MWTAKKAIPLIIPLIGCILLGITGIVALTGNVCLVIILGLVSWALIAVGLFGIANPRQGGAKP